MFVCLHFCLYGFEFQPFLPRFRQLSDTSFYAKVDKDITSANQKTVKTIQDLIDTEQGLPMTAKNVIVTIPRASRIYFKPKIHKPNNPGRPIISACSCRTELNSSYLDRIMVPMSLNLYHHTSKILTTHWKFFSISIFLTKQTYYDYGHYFFIYRNSR